MKKILLLVLLIATTLTGCEEPVEERTLVTEISIFGTRDKIVVAGEEVNLLKNIKINSNVDYSLLEYLEVTSEDCDVIDGIVESETENYCNVTYSITVDGVSDEVDIYVDFRQPYRTLELNEEHNDIRMYQIYVAAYQDGIEGGYGFGYGPSDHLGDLQGIINSLDYIASLNVNAIWLTPVFESKDHDSLDDYEKRGLATGYFSDSYYDIDPNFGTNELFRTLVDEAHARGLYIIMDGVFGHHGYYDIEGVTDGSSQWYGSQTVFPESLDYFIDVATYWIDEYNIDGWRLDQSYQLYQDNYNYFREIRNAVEDISNQRAEDGEEWGTLGYFVAEIWDVQSNIIKYGYEDNAFRSAFNFPLRSTLVSVLAEHESGSTAGFYELNIAMNRNALPDYAQPNLFITNHDTVRFGDLLQMSDNENQYYERHKLAISFLAQYTGPITLYYGDEYGDEFDGLDTSTGQLSSYLYIAQDNVARSNGQIDNFDTDQQDLIDYTTSLMALRDTYDSLWNGERENLMASDFIYADLKTSENNQILYVMNINDISESVTLDASLMNGTTVRNLETDEIYNILDGEITITIEAISAGFFIIE